MYNEMNGRVLNVVDEDYSRWSSDREVGLILEEGDVIRLDLVSRVERINRKDVRVFGVERTNFTSVTIVMSWNDLYTLRAEGCENEQENFDGFTEEELKVIRKFLVNEYSLFKTNSTDFVSDEEELLTKSLPVLLDYLNDGIIGWEY